MCTAIQWNGYFGRNLDLWCAYGESVVITPRRYPFRFRRRGEALPEHYAMIGMAHMADGYPLYYEAMNEKGLAMAGLHFPGNTCYQVPGTAANGETEVAPWELIPWVLGNFASAGEVGEAFGSFRVVNLPFREDMPCTPLHWIIADRDDCLVLECTADGQTMTADPVGVLTNSPPIACHLYRLQEYMHLSPKTPENRFFPYPEAQPGLPGFVPFTDTFHPYSGGMGAVGLPGDWSSSSRFVKAAYLRANTIPGGTKPLDAARFFHMLDAVAMPAGAVIVSYQGEDVPEITVYSCCMDLADGVYFYKTHENSRITAVDLYGGNPDETELAVYPMETMTDIRYVNRRREEDV